MNIKVNRPNYFELYKAAVDVGIALRFAAAKTDKLFSR